MSKTNNGIFNNYTVAPRNLTQYTAYRGVTDFSQIGQFNQFESGYQFLSVLDIPTFLKKDSSMDQMNKNFRHMLEFEFRGMDGLPDIQSDSFEITDGINSARMINKVTMDTAINVSMQYYEKAGSLITKYTEHYLTGIKDPKTQAKTYHGLIASGECPPGLENEVFTLMYYVTDNTMLRLERAVLLANCQLTRAELSMYNGSRDNISNKEMTIEFQCFPIYGYEVDRAAKYLLEHEITGVNVDVVNGNVQYNGVGSVAMDRDINGNIFKPTTLDSADYLYGIMDSNAPEKVEKLTNAITNS